MRARVCIFTRLFGGAYRWPTDGQVPPPPRRCPRLVATTRPRRATGPSLVGRLRHPRLIGPPRTGCATDYQRSRRRPSLAPFVILLLLLYYGMGTRAHIIININIHIDTCRVYYKLRYAVIFMGTTTILERYYNIIIILIHRARREYAPMVGTYVLCYYFILWLEKDDIKRTAYNNNITNEFANINNFMTRFISCSLPPPTRLADRRPCTARVVTIQSSVPIYYNRCVGIQIYGRSRRLTFGVIL